MGIILDNQFHTRDGLSWHSINETGFKNDQSEYKG